MSTAINPKQKTKAVKAAASAHLNWMGGPSWFLNNPINTLKMAAASCFFGEPSYYNESPNADKKSKKQHVSLYHDVHAGLSATQLKHLRDTLNAVDPVEWRSMTPAQLMESAIDKALDYNIEETLQVAHQLRHEDHIRLTPQIILARAAQHPKIKGTTLLRQYATGILFRPDDVISCFAYTKAKFGKIPTRLKRALGDKLATYNEYQLAKYRMEGHEYNLVDTVRMVWPSFNESDPLGKLMKGKLTLSGNETWESLISAKGSNHDSWTEAVGVMGHMALLRNLRNLSQNGVDPDLFTAKLIEGVKEGKQLPFRYFSAYKAVEGAGIQNPKLLDAIETCLEVSLAEVPSFDGRVMSLCDNSGSAQGATTSEMGSMHVNDIANLMGVITGKVSEEGYVGIFGDELKTFPITKKNSVFTHLATAEKHAKQIGEETENGIWLFWDKAIKQNEHWDHVFVYSDMQAGHGGLYGTDANKYRDYLWDGGHRYIDVAKLVAEYRKKVNPHVNVYLVQVAGYQDTIIPEFYDKTYILGGWSTGILKFAHKMAYGPKQ
jgi:hypothetical protein